MTDDQPQPQTSLSTSKQKQRLGGIKFSDAQVRLELAPVIGCVDLARVLGCFAKHRINLHQLSYGKDEAGGVEVYLAEPDYQHNSGLIHSELEALGVERAVSCPAGTLTLFPHESRMDVLLRVITIAGSPAADISGLCSSLSAFCITTDLDRLDVVADLLLEDFTLPEGHSPFRYQPSELDLTLSGGEGRVVETIARYRESVIKIYGSVLKTGLSWISASFSIDQLSLITGYLAGSGIERFEMMGMARAGSDRINLQLLVNLNHDPSAVDAMLGVLAGETGIECAVHHGKELLFFHGPHFQDRYGVMYTAVSALAKASLEIACAACSGTGVHLVTESGGGERMLEVLGEVFVVP